METKILKENPIIVNTTPIKDRAYRSLTPFISIDPATGERKEVATAQEDVANRIAFSKKTGIPVEQVSAPAPKSITPAERAQRENLIKGK